MGRGKAGQDGGSRGRGTAWPSGQTGGKQELQAKGGVKWDFPAGDWN